MPSGHADQILDMFVVEAVVDHFSFFSLPDKPKRSQESQLMRDSRFCDSEELSDVEHTQFMPRQCEDNLQTGRIPHHFEDLAEAVDRLIVCERGAGLANR